MPKVSIIIPCYNQAQYLRECLDSVMAQTFQDFEVIVVDDGSTSPDSKEIFASLNYPKTKIIHQENQGVMATRNNGIAASSGEYILPLDADDKIALNFLEKAVSVLDENPNIGIVGGQTELFGAKTGRFELPAYQFPAILEGNCLVCSCLYRRSDWDKVGGYNSNMVDGWEDYDFWLSLIEAGAQVQQLDDVCLYYRQTENSRNDRLDKEKRMKLMKQIIQNHLELYKVSKKQLSSDICDLVNEVNHAFFYKSKTDTHKIYHLGGLTLKVRRKNKVPHLYYFSTVRNFGDLLNVDLFKFFNKKMKQALNQYDSDILAIGSLLQSFVLDHKVKRKQYSLFSKSLIVYGSGFIADDDQHYAIRKMDVRAVRGFLTLERLKKMHHVKISKNVVIGDPGLLISKMYDVSEVEKKYDLGIIPHYVDKDSPLLDKIKVKNSVVIDIQQNPEIFIKQIAECKNVISSAMHGLIAADSLGIPNIRMILSEKITGGDYKYNDYYSAFGLKEHKVVNLYKQVFTDEDLPDIANNYNIIPEQVEKICKNLIEKFPYKEEKCALK